MATMLGQLLRPAEVIAPDLPLNPNEAIGLLQGIVDSSHPDIVVGHSLGGFLVLHLKGVKRVAVNPDLHPSILLRFKKGTMNYLSPRADGATEFTISEGVCRLYEKAEALTAEGEFLGLFADEDELVRCGPEFERLYPGKAKKYPGGHLPTFPDMKNHIVAAIKDLLLVP